MNISRILKGSFKNRKRLREVLKSTVKLFHYYSLKFVYRIDPRDGGLAEYPQVIYPKGKTSPLVQKRWR